MKLSFILWVGGLGCCLMLGTAGCATGSGGTAGGGAAGKGSIDQVFLVAMPVAVNLDQVPGSDGFAVKVYLGNRIQPKTQAMKEGTLEILMYDGIPASSSEREPLRLWSFSPEDLRVHEMKGAAGIGYSFSLSWGKAVPKERKITVVARYRAPDGSGIRSAATPIAVAD